MTNSQHKVFTKASAGPAAQVEPVHNGQDEPVTHDQIARCAYDIYIRSGRTQGRCTQNWNMAEKSLRDRAREHRQEDSSQPFVPHSINPR